MYLIEYLHLIYSSYIISLIIVTTCISSTSDCTESSAGECTESSTSDCTENNCNEMDPNFSESDSYDSKCSWLASQDLILYHI